MHFINLFSRSIRTGALVGVIGVLAVTMPATQAQRAALSDKPDTPFKLATFETNGRVRIGLTSGNRLVDILEANTYVAQKAALPALSMPGDMLKLIEEY